MGMGIGMGTEMGIGMGMLCMKRGRYWGWPVGAGRLAAECCGEAQVMRTWDADSERSMYGKHGKCKMDRG